MVGGEILCNLMDIAIVVVIVMVVVVFRFVRVEDFI
jgi:hypothetical protein